MVDAYPDRHVLGLGFGGEQRPGTTPMAAMSPTLTRPARSRAGTCSPT